MDGMCVRSLVCLVEGSGLKINIDTTALKLSRWQEHLVRFGFGGAVTAFAGIVAKRFGPEIGGLFLAFPAIFPAAATLIQKHEKRKKERIGKDGSERGRTAAGLDALGAALGGIGMMVFAVIVWQQMPTSGIGTVLMGAMLGWVLSSVLAWDIWQRFRKHARAERTHTSASRLRVGTRSEPITSDRRIK